MSIEISVGDHFIYKYNFMEPDDNRDDHIDYQVTRVSGTVRTFRGEKSRPYFKILAKTDKLRAVRFDGYAQDGKSIVNIWRENDSLILTKHPIQLELF